MHNPWVHFRSLTNTSPPKSQWEWLEGCLSRNQTSLYGTQYQFADINSIASYQDSVPVVTYEDLKPWVDRLVDTGNVLFTEPVVAYEKTGGSHSGGKLIPYSQSGLEDFRRALLPWLAELIEHYDINHGVAYWALSPALRKNTRDSDGISLGGDAIYLGADNLAAFLELSAVPLSIADIEDLTDWQLVTLYYLIVHDDLRLISIWSPTFLTQLMNALLTYQEPLRMLLAEGGCIAGHVLHKDSKALQRLANYLTHQNPRELWPDLAVISCWADASSAMLLKDLRKIFPNVPIQPKGLLSTEAVITTPNSKGQGLLCLQSNFYEFMDEAGDIHLADGLVDDQTYQVIVTTNSGLYRYLTGDQVLCLGYEGNQPILKFLGRAGVVSDYVGEKLTEGFVSHCLGEASGDCVILAFDQEQQGYRLLINDLLLDRAEIYAEAVEELLCQNPQYAYARQLNQLAPVTYVVIRDLDEQYIEWQLRQGKRLGDIKIPSLLTQDWRQIFS